ncbi:MAG: YktB family protein [Heyndrickxia sp.]
MTFNGFTNEDFDLFLIDGLDARMEKLISTLRPKLEYLGAHFSPALSVLTGEEIFPHVAKHARRTINPPNDTWVAFANNKRGYKMVPHFQIGLWHTHLFVWLAVIYESPLKVEYGKKFAKNISKIIREIPSSFVWSGDHMKPDAKAMKEMSKDDLMQLFTRVQTVKKSEILCGINIPREQVVKMSGDQLLNQIQDTFNTLVPLYKL